MATFAATSSLFKDLPSTRDATGKETSDTPGNVTGTSRWKLVSYVPSSVIVAGLGGVRNNLVLISIIVVVPAGLGSWILTRFGVRRKIAENALIQSEKQYKRLVETMNDGLGVTDENDTVTSELSQIRNTVYNYWMNS